MHKASVGAARPPPVDYPTLSAALLDILIQLSTDVEDHDLKLTALRTLSKLCTNVLNDPLNER